METKTHFFQQYINGEWYAPRNGKFAEILNPANGKVVGVIADGDEADALNALSASANTNKKWQQTPLTSRKYHLNCFLKEIRNNRQEIAQVLHHEQGKYSNVAFLEIDLCCLYLEYAIETSFNLPKVEVTNGTEVIFTDWDFPLALLGRKVGNSLISGNTTIIHPTCNSPLSSFMLADLSKKAGLPNGVFNIINGEDKRICSELAKHPSVCKVSMVKSSPIERTIFGSISALPDIKDSNPIKMLYSGDNKSLEALNIEYVYEKHG